MEKIKDRLAARVREAVCSVLMAPAAALAVGEYAANDHSYGPSLSANGRYLAFTSLASNLVPEDTNGIEDVFLLDRQWAT